MQLKGRRWFACTVVSTYGGRQWGDTWQWWRRASPRESSKSSVWCCLYTIEAPCTNIGASVFVLGVQTNIHIERHSYAWFRSSERFLRLLLIFDRSLNVFCMLNECLCEMSLCSIAPLQVDTAVFPISSVHYICCHCRLIPQCRHIFYAFLNITSMQATKICISQVRRISPNILAL